MPENEGQHEGQARDDGHAGAPVQPGNAPAVTQVGKCYASIYPGPAQELPATLSKVTKDLERVLGMQIWLLIQDGGGDYDDLMGKVKTGFYVARRELPNEPVALVVDSYGGLAKSAFLLAKLLRRHCGGFTAVVPRRAKSAATLLALGANRLIMGRHAELGPLDVQIWDSEREEYSSALDEVQALERLYASSFEAFDQLMYLLVPRTRKRTDTLLPVAAQFIAELAKPLFEKIDSVHYTQRSRALKVGEEYLIRLLQPRYNSQVAKEIARKLVHTYPEHGFAIDADELEALGLVRDEITSEQTAVIDSMCDALDGVTAIGRFQEVNANAPAAQ